MRRPLTLLMAGLLSLAATSAAFLIDNSPASAAPIADAPITLCADPDTDPLIETSQAGGMITCDTTITNNITAIDPISGVASGTSVIQVTECTGPANGRLDPNDLTCVTDQQNLVDLVTHVDQCNGVGYGGGAVLECNVDVINNFIGVTPQVIGDATVNQCNGSAPVTTGCNPFPASTTNATITQCNNSSYGGGQEDFNCIATGSTTTASLSVTVNQCNDSNYGGGSWLNCSASLTNNVVPLAPTPSLPNETATPTAAATPTASATVIPAATPAATPTASATVIPAATPTAAPTPSELPETSTARPTAPQQGGTGFPLLMIAMVLLAFPLWKIYTDRGVKLR